jgi:hypothetical protein
VWLHWDPQTVKARGARAMMNLRMDFLMLVPGGHRIVLEVDGKHHYATGTLADPSVYAATMRGDRDLKLARYDVFRFGTADLDEERPAREMLRAFFRRSVPDLPCGLTIRCAHLPAAGGSGSADLAGNWVVFGREWWAGWWGGDRWDHDRCASLGTGHRRPVLHGAFTLGRPADLTPDDRTAEWILSKSPEIAFRLVESRPNRPGEAPPGTARVGFAVPDADAERRRLTGRLAELPEVRRRPGVIALLSCATRKETGSWSGRTCSTHR